MRVRDFINEMNKLAPFGKALEWDNVGLLVGSQGSLVSKVFVCLDVTQEVIEQAAKEKCDLILSHHPLIFHGIKNITTETSIGTRICELIATGISCIAMHTNFDVKVMGAIVSERLGFNRYQVLDITDESGFPSGIGTVCDLETPIELSVLAGHVKESLIIPFATYFGDPDCMVKRAAIVPGSGKSEIQSAIMAGCDVLITGDISHHEGIDAVLDGLCIIDAGHYGTEYIFVEYMKEYIKKHLPELSVVSEKPVFPRRLI